MRIKGFGGRMVMVERADIAKALDKDVVGMTRDLNAVLESTDFGVRAKFRKHFQTGESQLAWRRRPRLVPHYARVNDR